MLRNRRINWLHVTTIVSVTILVGTELVAISWAAAWALGGLFELPLYMRYVLETAGTLAGFAGLYYFVRAAVKVEPLTGRIDEQPETDQKL